MNNLGFCFENGIGIEANKEAAFQMYQKSAKLDNPLGFSSSLLENQKKLIGIYNLAVLYEKGVGCPKNEKKSMKLYALAAYLGEPSG